MGLSLVILNSVCVLYFSLWTNVWCSYYSRNPSLFWKAVMCPNHEEHSNKHVSSSKTVLINSCFTFYLLVRVSLEPSVRCRSSRLSRYDSMSSSSLQLPSPASRSKTCGLSKTASKSPSTKDCSREAVSERREVEMRKRPVAFLAKGWQFLSRDIKRSTQRRDSTHQGRIQKTEGRF